MKLDKDRTVEIVNRLHGYEKWIVMNQYGLQGRVLTIKQMAEYLQLPIKKVNRLRESAWSNIEGYLFKD